MTDRVGLTFAQDGLIYSIKELPHIDLTKPWWSQKMNEALSIHNKLYFAYGDYNLTTFDYTHVLVYNKAIAERNQLGNIYDLVNDGKWTFDVYGEMAETATQDLNGDTVMDENDIFGFVSDAKQVLPDFWIAGGVTSISKDADDTPIFTLEGDEKFYGVIEKIFSITRDNNSWTDGVFNKSDVSLFKNGGALFADSSFKGVSGMRDMNDDFGIIPFPKYDEAQDAYYSRVEGGMVTMVPKTNTKLEMTGAVLEALAYESRKTTIHAYYDTALKGKYARDPESVEMLDLIFDGRIYDLGDTYWCDVLRDGVFQTMFAKDNRDIASVVARVKNQINEAIDKNVEAFDALED